MEDYQLVAEKKALRRSMLAEREAMDPVKKQEYDARICQELTDWVEKNRAKVVHTYLPIGSEININPAIQHWLDTGVRVVCPKALPARKLLNLEMFGFDKLEKGHFNTRHPAHATPFTGDYDLIIVPGLAFDSDNMRLGYGSGYYDIFLAAERGHRLGICYPFQVKDSIPVSDRDTQLDGVLYFTRWFFTEKP